MTAAHVLNPAPEPPGKTASVLLAVAMHVLLAIFLIYGIRWQTQHPEAISVELVSAPPAPTAEAQPAPPPEPVQKVETRPEPKPEPKPAPPPPKPDIAVKEKEKPKPVPKEAPPPKADPLAEQARREAEQMQQRSAAAAELDKLKADQANAARSRDVADYLGRIRGKIRGNIVLPSDVRGNPEAVFDVTQLPSGEILGVKLKKSSGHAALDANIERAILKSSPLPKPEKPELFNRSLELKFRPLED